LLRRGSGGKSQLQGGRVAQIPTEGAGITLAAMIRFAIALAKESCRFINTLQRITLVIFRAFMPLLILSEEPEGRRGSGPCHGQRGPQDECHLLVLARLGG